MGPLTRVRGGQRARLGAAAALGIALAASVATSARAADSASFGAPSASSKFGAGIDFVQPVTFERSVDRVEILLATPGAIGPQVEAVPDAATTGSTTLRYHLDLADGGTGPNTPFTARWRLIDADGTATLGPPVTQVYADDRFDWKTIDGDLVRVHWVEGDRSFGQRALRIGDEAVKSTANELGVTETEPIDFFIYADQDAFYDALGPATRENVGGQARPDIRTLFALITPDQIDASWVETVVPHELAHVVFQTAIDNPYHEPPHWLNEGLAVYLSAGYDAGDRRQVESAAQDGSIIPLDGLAGAFPTSADRFFLAYAESVSAVDRIVRVHGRDALVKLIRSYAGGVSDDEAFQAALGRNLGAFQADWLAELRASPPTKIGPRPAPPGPLPAGWIGPQPNPSFEVTGSLPPQRPGAPRPRGLDDPIARFLVPSVGVLGVALIAVIAVIAGQRARRRQDAAVGEPRWNQVYGRPKDEGEATPAARPVDMDGDPAQAESDVPFSLPRDPEA